MLFFYILYLCNMFMCFGLMCIIPKVGSGSLPHWRSILLYNLLWSLCGFPCLVSMGKPATLWKKPMLFALIYDLIFSVVTHSSRPIAEVWIVHWPVNRDLDMLTHSYKFFWISEITQCHRTSLLSSLLIDLLRNLTSGQTVD